MREAFHRGHLRPHGRGAEGPHLRVIKALCLHVAHTCNLNCSYCFASQGKYHGDRALMSYEVGKQALDFLMDHSGTRHNLEVDFFGGEPLMNFDVVKRLVAYARSVEKEQGQALPLYPDHQWGAHRRRRHRLRQPGDEQCGAESGRTARRSMTATGWTMQETAAGRRSFPSSRSWCRPGRGRTTICGGPSPTPTPTFEGHPDHAGSGLHGAEHGAGGGCPR